MSELEQLNQQKLQIQQNQEMLSNWISLKKNLSSKFKSAQEIFKALKKDGKGSLSVDDFEEYSKGLDLSLLFKDIDLNEANFGKIWKNWEFKQKQNEHKLQILNEKLQLLAILEDNEKNRETKTNVTSNNIVSKLTSDCETLSQLQEKLDTLVEEGQRQKSKQDDDAVQNEEDYFSFQLSKKNEQKSEELYVNRLQKKSNEDSEGNKQAVNKIIRSYIEGQTHHFKSITELNGNELLQNSLSNKGYLANSSKSYKLSYINKPINYISPPKEIHTVRVQSKQNQQQQKKSPYEEKQQQERKSHKISRMKGDLKSYISQLFFHEKEFRQNNILNRRPTSEEFRGLSGFMNSKQCSKNQLPQFIELQDSNTQKRFQNIRHKLDDFQIQRLSQNTYITKTQPNFSPDKTDRSLNQNVLINLSSKLNSKYSPGNTHRLNLEYLNQERVHQKQKIQDNLIESEVLE
ncbi:unnamed protein product [Paramecium sonneborni]|uniref:EF-hand domain-containing protein n=1 Tax=Paramecium sonneborni TaxID=65129 RepID=A0A8S1N007_9CILI|nr:unnamed protein product [Paramecium sonneborni]